MFDMIVVRGCLFAYETIHIDGIWFGRQFIEEIGVVHRNGGMTVSNNERTTHQAHLTCKSKGAQSYP